MAFRKKKEDFSTLEDILESTWRFLHDGVQDFRNPFHHATLTTIDDNKPQARIVILREFSEKDRTLIYHCDARGAKVSQIRDNHSVSCLFYDPKRWLQLRLSGPASLHTDDDVADSQWEKVGIHHRINYSSEAPPGSPAQKPASRLPDFFGDKARALLDSTKFRKNFAVIVCKFDEMDWLLLKLTGHTRAKFQWKDNRMDASWVIP